MQDFVIQQHIPHRPPTVEATIVQLSIFSIPVDVGTGGSCAVHPVQRLEQFFQEVVNILLGDVMLRDVLELERRTVQFAGTVHAVGHVGIEDRE